ncbi:helix-turn-helix transcriptional regulator [Streptomyces sp. NPDC051320]|uniref:helix-turn-helix domain-containing protein n=1 Tax=Streptomyces sp. NPDC051320 TaxID=3154644 RepID=UPI003432CD5A
MTAPRATYEVDGAAIRTIRMARGIQIADLARTARITRSYLSRLETGVRRQMRPPTYTALRTALGIQADDEQLLAPRDTDTE